MFVLAFFFFLGGNFLKEVPPQTVDKTNGFRQIDESFGQAFSKACAVEAAQASSPSAEGEKPVFRRFSFC